MRRTCTAAFWNCHSSGRALPGTHVMKTGECRPACCKAMGRGQGIAEQHRQRQAVCCCGRAHLVRGRLASGAVPLWGAQEGALSRLQPLLLRCNPRPELLHNSKIQLSGMSIHDAVPIRILHTQLLVRMQVHASCWTCNSCELQKRMLQCGMHIKKHTGTLQTSCWSAIPADA